MTQDRIVWQAEFNSAVTKYWLVNGMFTLLITLVGIPFIPIWYFVGKFFAQKYLDSHSCILTDRSLKVSKGLFTKIEKTVPLDRLTDVGVVQGPIMRYFEIESLSVETAGQSAEGSLVRLAGIVNGREFRDAILKQRDLVVGSSESSSPSATTHSTGAAGMAESGGQSVELLREIRDSLHRIESGLNNRNS